MQALHMLRKVAITPVTFNGMFCRRTKRTKRTKRALQQADAPTCLWLQSPALTRVLTCC